MCWVIKSPKETEEKALAQLRELWQMGMEHWWNGNQEGKKTEETQWVWAICRVRGENKLITIRSGSES